MIIITNKIYKGIAPEQDREKLISTLNEIFFSDENDRGVLDFVGLLPKLYKEEYNPCAHNYVVKEGDDIKAAVGIYYSDISVCGQTLKCGGIGNVGVTLDSRSKGYMIDCMNLSMKDMFEKNADLGFLGGQRQRYAYFSFEPSGICYDFGVTKRNLRHCYGSERKNDLDIKKLAPEDTYFLEEIEKLLRTEEFYAPHELNNLFDLLCSWKATPYAVSDSGIFKGFFIVNKENENLMTFKAVDRESLIRLVYAALEVLPQKSGLNFRVPAFDKMSIDLFTEIGEGFSLCHVENFTVLSFENVCNAFLKLQSTLKPLCEASIVLLIHGYKGDEKIELSVCNGKPSATKTDKPHDLEIGHHEAIRMLFSICSIDRQTLPGAVSQWLPLPLFGYSCDGV